MKIDKKNDCRFWGYEPESVSDARTGTKTPEEKRQAREKGEKECAIIKGGGFLARKYGLTKLSAIRAAKAIEKKFPDIEMRVFTHDYL